MARSQVLPNVTLNTGQGVSGALVHITNRADGSNATIYADETSATTLTNPTTTDVDGRIVAWLPQGRYNLTVSGAGIASYTLGYNVYCPDAPLITTAHLTAGDITVAGTPYAGVSLTDQSALNPIEAYRLSGTQLDLVPPTGTTMYYSANGGQANFGYDGVNNSIAITDNQHNLPFKINLSTGGVLANVATLTAAGQLQLPTQGSGGGIQFGGDAQANLYWTATRTIRTDGNLNVAGNDTDTSFTVTGVQPATVSGSGTSLTNTVSVTGAKGGNTTGTTGQVGGTGGSLLYQAGAGGDAPAGSTNGVGGSISLNPGVAGSGVGGAGTIGSVNIGITGCKIGLYGVPAVSRQTGYTITNPTTNRTINETSYTTDQLAQVLGTLITDLKNTGIIG